MNVLLPLVASGIALGSVYAVIALGFVLVFKSTSILNFAQGEFVMMAMYLGLLTVVVWALPAVFAIVLVALAMAMFGLVMHYAVVRPLTGKPFFSLVLATIGVGLIIRALVTAVFGVKEQSPLAILPQGALVLSAASVSYADMTITLITVVTVVAFAAFFRWTTLGLHMRAVADSLEAASIVGINTNRVFATAWTIGLVVSAIGGILYANYTSSLDLSLSEIGLRAVPAAIIGGLTSIPGAIVGGLLLGLLEQLGAGYMGAQWRDLFAFGSLFIVLMLRPQGIFGRSGAERV
jgi:branched-chain amino acid transport system permease protein